MDNCGVFYTKVKVTFNDGSSFEGDEVQVSLVAGFTAKSRGGVKETLFLASVPCIAQDVEPMC